MKNGGSEVDGEELFVESLEPTTTEDGVTVGTLIGFSVPEPNPDDYLDYLREQSGESGRRFEGGIESLPVAFEPSVAPTCLH